MTDAYLDACSRSSVVPLPHLVEALDACASSGTLAWRGSNAFARITDADCDALAESLSATRCESLDLSNHQIGDSGAAALTSDGRLGSIIVLNLAENSIGWAGGKSLGAHLLQCPALEELVLDANPLGEVGGVALAALVEAHPRLSQLRLCRCDLSIGALIALSESLSRTANLRLLDISEPILYDRNEEASAHIARALASNSSLVRLAMRKYPFFADNSTERLCEALLDNASLRELDLSANGLGPPSGEHLANALTSGANLSVLQLANCRLRSSGAIPLALALESGLTGLRYLDLCKNGIEQDGIVALCKALASPNCTLENLFMWGNPGLESGGAGANAVAALMDSRTLRCTLDVAVTMVDGEAQVCELKN